MGTRLECINQKKKKHFLGCQSSFEFKFWKSKPAEFSPAPASDLSKKWFQPLGESGRNWKLNPGQELYCIHYFVVYSFQLSLRSCNLLYLINLVDDSRSDKVGKMLAEVLLNGLQGNRYLYLNHTCNLNNSVNSWVFTELIFYPISQSFPGLSLS